MNAELYHCILLLLVLVGLCCCPRTEWHIGICSLIAAVLLISLVVFFCVNALRRLFFSPRGRPLRLSVGFFLGGILIYGIIFCLLGHWHP